MLPQSNWARLCCAIGDELLRERGKPGSLAIRSAREPVGLLSAAAAVCCLIGWGVNPIGWAMAAAIGSVLIAAVAYPLLAVWSVKIAVRPRSATVRRYQRVPLTVSIANRLPVPLFMVQLEGYAAAAEATTEAVGVIALPTVAAARRVDYEVWLRPHRRGVYPDGDVYVTCSGPLGIWTARRRVLSAYPLTVWPTSHRLNGDVGGRRVDVAGYGSMLSGGGGPAVGVRGYQPGDRVRQIHWIATARQGELMVRHSCGGRCDALEIHLSIAGGTMASLEQRIEVAATLIDAAIDRGMICRLVCSGVTIMCKSRPRAALLDFLARLPQVPTVVEADSKPTATQHNCVAIWAAGDDTICLSGGLGTQTIGAGKRMPFAIPAGAELQSAVERWWRRASDATAVA